MKKPSFTNQFQKDMEQCKKRRKDIIKIKAVMFDIICKNVLDANYKNHNECHIELDWLLIYLIDGDEVKFVRTGTHSDLFK